jgi:hypothetical protein
MLGRQAEIIPAGWNPIGGVLAQENQGGPTSSRRDVYGLAPDTVDVVFVKLPGQQT